MSSVLGLAGLLVANALLAAGRAAFANVPAANLRSRVETADLGARLALLVLEDSPRLLLTLRFTQMFVRLLFAGGVAVALMPVLESASWVLFALLALAATLGLIIVAELGPQAIVVREPEAWVIRLAPLLIGLGWLVTPISSLLRWVSDRMVVPLNQHAPIMVTPDEIKTLVDAGEKDGSIEQDEKRMIYSVFQFSDTLVREVMIPRIDIVALDVETQLMEALDVIVKHGYSRIPVFEGTVDDILGVLYAKDLLTIWLEGKPGRSLRKQLRPAYFVPETKKVDDLLGELQAQRIHMAIVVDEYGGMAGVVTLEDLVEELIGEVQDEYDTHEEVPFRQVGEGQYLVHGRMDLDDINRKLGTDIDSGEADTLAGFIYGQLGRVPDPGEQLEIEGLMLEVRNVVERQIRQVRVTRIPVSPSPHGEGAPA